MGGLGLHAQTLLYDVTVDLKAPSSTVAVQFDLGGNANISISGVSLLGMPDHLVETNFVNSVQRSRVVIYSIGGEAIATSGRLQLQLSVAASQNLTNGMLQVSNVLGSDANGVATALQPNLQPLIYARSPIRRTPVVSGQSIGLSARVVDLDGSLQSASFRLDGAFLANVSAGGTFNWLGATVGTRILTIFAQDNRTDTTTTPPVDLVVYDPSTISSFNAFRDLHFSAAEITAGAGNAATDPFGSGFDNLTAYFLDIEPGSPDFSREPTFQIETLPGGAMEGVLTFVRRTTLPSGLQWQIRKSTDLVTDSALEPEQISEETLVGGRTRVTARVPVPPGVTGQFLHLSLTLN